MRLFTIFNKARVVSATSPPMTQAKQAPTISVYSGPTGGTAKDVAEGRDTITQADVMELLAYSRVLDSKVQYRVHPIADNSWESDEFNLKYLTEKFLGPYPIGKNYFWQAIWGLANPAYSTKMVMSIIEEAGGLDSLCPKDWQEAATLDLKLWCRTQSLGTQHSLSAAYRIASNRMGSMAGLISDGTSSLDTQIQPDFESVRSHCNTVMASLREVQGQIAQRHAGRMQDVCAKLRQAAIRLVERQAELEETRAAEDETAFRSSQKLLGLIHFGMLDRIGAAGHFLPYWNVVSLGCALPPDPAPWAGVNLFEPPPEYVESLRLARASLAFARPPVSDNLRQAARKPDLSKIKINL